VSNSEPIGIAYGASIGITSSMTSRDYDIMLVMSRFSKSHSETRTRINYPFLPFKQTLPQNMRISTNGNVKFSLECLSLGIVDIPTL